MPKTHNFFFSSQRGFKPRNRLIGISNLKKHLDCFLIGSAIRSTAEFSEKVIFVAATMTGFLMYFGSRAMGVAIPALLLPAISDPNPYKVGLIGLLIPGAAGAFVAWHGLRCLHKGTAIFWRLLLMVATFVVTLFGDVYASTFAVAFLKNGVDASLLPNLAFQIGITLHLIFHYQTQNRTGLSDQDSRVRTHFGSDRFHAGSPASRIGIPMGN